MDNKKKLLIGGGIAVAIIILIVLFVVFGKDDAKENKTTTSAQSTSGVTEEITTLEDDSTEATNEETSSEIVEESSDEETTSTVIEESSEDTTTKSEAVVDKETTTRKENSTTKKNETTTKKQVSKETTTKKQTTTAKQTTTKQETTTQEQTTVKPKPQSGRIKECELALVDKCVDFYPDYVNEGSIYTYIEGKFNPYIYQRDHFGWENMCIYVHQLLIEDKAYYANDDFALKYPDDEIKQLLIRDIHFMKKYNQAIIEECDKWVKGTSVYNTAEEFVNYMDSRYSDSGKNSIFNETRDEQWYKKWCYWDEQRQEYRTSYIQYICFSAISYEKEGYFTDVEEIYKKLANENAWYIDPPGFYCRWIYDANTDKTTIYVVTMYS